MKRLRIFVFRIIIWLNFDRMRELTSISKQAGVRNKVPTNYIFPIERLLLFLIFIDLRNGHVVEITLKSLFALASQIIGAHFQFPTLVLFIKIFFFKLSLFCGPTQNLLTTIIVKSVREWLLEYVVEDCLLQLHALGLYLVEYVLWYHICKG
jgi:hypothetical protein